MHDVAADITEYLPAPHSVHELAPALVPVLVIEPAPQSLHAATFDAVEYLPAAHAAHAVAPAAEPVSVIEPAWHGAQNDLPPSV